MPSYEWRWVPLSIRGKFIALACCIAFFTALIVGGIIYLRVVEATREAAVARLMGQIGLLVPELRIAHEELRNDVLKAAYTSPIQGLVRSITNGGVDPIDGSTTTLWRQRLETTFAAVMEQRPDYVQMRFIGVADHGRELVRVNRRGRRTQAVPPEQLQQKGDEPYFLDGLALAGGQIFFSDVTLNRDYGTESPTVPVIRALTPIFGPDNRLFGLVVINAHYGRLLQAVLRRSLVNGTVYILTDSGDFVVKVEGRTPSELQFRGAQHEFAPQAIRLLQKGKIKPVLFFEDDEGQNTALLREKMQYGEYENRHVLTVAAIVSEEDILSEAHAARRSALLLALLLIGLSSFVALFFARLITRPLQRIVDETRAFGKGDGRLDLPISLSDEIGELSRAFVNLVDNLEDSRRDARDALARIKTMRTQTVDALITIDAEGTILEFNNSAERLFGYADEEVSGENIRMLMPQPHKQAHDGYLKRYLQTGKKKVIGDVRVVDGLRKDGTTFPAELRVSDIVYGGVRYFDGIIRDISERVAMEQQVAEYTKDLERSNRDLDDFAYLASHDLKEPLRAVANHIRFLREDHEAALGDDGKRRIERIDELCQRADKLTSDLYSWSRLSRDAFERHTVDLAGVVEEVVRSLADLIEERNAQVQTVGPLPSVTGDRSRLSRVFANLIVNAIKYNDRPQKEVSIGFRPNVAGPHGAVLGAYFVADNGIGIAKEYQDSAFNMFKRLNTERAYGPGTGVGLTFIKTIVERHGGQIWIESTPGEGSTFYFTLPGDAG